MKFDELLTRSNLEDKLLKSDITTTGGTANKVKSTKEQIKNCNKQAPALKNIAPDLTETSGTNLTATKIDVNASESVASNTTKSHNGDTMLTAIKDSSLDTQENNVERQNNSAIQTDIGHHLSKSENNTITNILIIQKTISKQNSKSIGTNLPSESPINVHRLQSNDALLHTSIKDSLSNSSITVLLSNHNNNNSLTTGLSSNGRQILNLGKFNKG